MFFAVTLKAWTYSCHTGSMIFFFFLSILSFSTDLSSLKPQLLKGSAAVLYKHTGLSYRKRKAATLQWQHLWEVKPPNPNDPLFFPATVSAEV